MDTRVSKVDSGGTATYKRDGAHVTAPVIGDGSAVYTPGISERRSSTTKFYGADRLGTNSVETNTLQAVTATKTYDAFGMPVGSTGSSASPFGFAAGHGYQEDGQSSLKLLGHRYYDSNTGRFQTRDPIKDGRNWYTYCDNNPLKRVDSNGLEHHNPTRVKVSPNFKGKVWAIGETGSDNKPRRTPVKPGEITHPDMDVDYITVVQPDGTERKYFLPGVTKGLGNLGPNQTYRIDKDGTVHWDWLQDWNTALNGWPPIQIEGPGSWLPWPFDEWPTMREGSRTNPFPADKRPYKF